MFSLDNSDNIVLKLPLNILLGIGCLPFQLTFSAHM